MEKIRFSKFCASGNDFIIIDNRRHIVPEPESKFAERISRRKFSIGADGVLLLDKIKGRFRMRIFNPDGSEAEMCGNGGRAFARFIYGKGLSGKNISFLTEAGDIRAKIFQKSVRLKMSLPEDIRLNIPLRIKGKNYTGHFINTGVPHCVVFVKTLEEVPVKYIGKIIRFHKRFKPRGTNVDFISVKGGRVFLRTYERGVEDETLACGTGAVASGIIGFLLGKVKKTPVEVAVRGGELRVYFKERRLAGRRIFQDVYLEGDARLVCEGTIEEDAYV